MVVGAEQVSLASRMSQLSTALDACLGDDESASIRVIDDGGVPSLAVRFGVNDTFDVNGTDAIHTYAEGLGSPGRLRSEPIDDSRVIDATENASPIDQIAVTGCRIDDADPALVKDVVARFRAEDPHYTHLDDADVLAACGVVAGNGAGAWLSLAGAVCLLPRPDVFVAGACVEVRVHASADNRPRSDGTLWWDYRRVAGPLPRIVSEVARIVERAEAHHLIVAGAGKPAWVFAPGAVRELVTNAWVHRDWTDPAPIRVDVFDDRLQIVAPGYLPQVINPAGLGHTPVAASPNPLVCAVAAHLSDAGGESLAHHDGSGWMRVARLCADDGVDIPHMCQSGDGVCVTVMARRQEAVGGLPIGWRDVSAGGQVTLSLPDGPVEQFGELGAGLAQVSGLGGVTGSQLGVAQPRERKKTRKKRGTVAARRNAALVGSDPVARADALAGLTQRQVEVLSLLEAGMSDVGQIAGRLGVTRAAAGRHLVGLKQAGLVRSRRRGHRQPVAWRVTESTMSAAL